MNASAPTSTRTPAASHGISTSRASDAVPPAYALDKKRASPSPRRAPRRARHGPCTPTPAFAHATGAGDVSTNGGAGSPTTAGQASSGPTDNDTTSSVAGAGNGSAQFPPGPPME